MNARIISPRTAALALCLLITNPLSSQTIKRWTPAEILDHAQPGQWVDIDATIEKDQTISVLEIEILSGDFMDDDWQLKAKVRSVNPPKNELHVLSLPVRVTKDTEFDENLDSLADLKPDMFVKIEGTYTKDGIFLAKEIDDRSGRIKSHPQLEATVEAVGRVEQVDKVKHTLTVMGISFIITEATDGKSLIK